MTFDLLVNYCNWKKEHDDIIIFFVYRINDVWGCVAILTDSEAYQFLSQNDSRCVCVNLIKILSFDPLPWIATKGSNETPVQSREYYANQKTSYAWA